MSEVKFSEPTAEDILAVGGDMREADKLEVLLSSASEPMQSLEWSVAVSRLVWVAKVDGDPFVIFGVGESTLASTTGSPWALASTNFSKYRREFARWSRPIVALMAEEYEHLENWVLAGNITSVRWVRSCGFTLDPAVPHGPAGALFHRFHRHGSLYV